MEYLTAGQAMAAAENRISMGQHFCPYCLSALARIPHTRKYYCPNDMCYNEEQGKIEKEKEHEGSRGNR